MKHKAKQLLTKPSFSHARFSRTNLIAFIIVFAVIGGYFIYKSFAASLPVVYIAQAQAGTNDGSSCANAHAASFFNTAGNWGTNSTQIGPGTTVHLCGTISTELTAQGNGASGSPVTLLFESGAKLSQPAGDLLNLNNRSYITVDGGSNGIIENTANGTHLANHDGVTAITAKPCNNCEIKNVTIQNMYVIASGDTSICSSGCAIDNAGVRCIDFSGDNWKIDNNTMHDASWCLVEEGDDANTQIYNNNIYNFDHGWVPGGGDRGNLYFHNNHIHDTAAWDNCNANGNNCHHDGIHCYDIPGPAHFNGVYIYDNTWDGAVGSSMTSWIYLESNTGSSCADSTSKWYIFNNYFGSTDQVPTNPYVGSTTGPVVTPYYLYNNTFAGPGSGKFGGNQANCVYASKDFENNAVGGCASLGTSGSGTTDYNAYANGSGTNCFPAGCSAAAFTSWQASHDQHGVYSPAGANGSNVTGVGTNLTSLCTGDLIPLCSDINGNPRPATGAWDAGASQLSATGNLWVDTNGGSCTRQSAAGAYNDAQACSSMQAAQTAAVAGDKIILKCGTYPAQSLSSSAKASIVSYYAETYTQAVSAADVLNTTSCVKLASLTVSIDKVHVYGLQASSQGFVNGGQNMNQLTTLEVDGTALTDVLIDGWRGHVANEDSTGTTFSHMELGNANFCSSTAEERDAMHMWASGVPSNNDHITNSVLHDWYDGSASPDGGCGQGDAGAHNDCIQSPGGDNMDISGNLFYKCGSSSIIQFGEFSGGLMGAIRVENNYFGDKPTEFNILSMGQGHCSGVVIRNNDFESGSFDNNGGCIGTPTQSNNIMLAAVTSCNNGGSFSGDHNIFVLSGGTTCGSNAKQCNPSFSAGLPSGYNYWEPKLNASDTCAKDYVTATAGTYPATDFYGIARPQGTAVDAGAAEYNTGGTGTPAPTVTISANPTNITSGGSSTLTWSSTNATACTASGAWSGSKATSGTQSVSPITTSTYTLTCSGAGGSSSPASATVNLPVVGDFTIGEATILSQGDNGNANLLLAQSTSLQQAATIKSLSFYVTNAAGKLRLGIYDASGPNGGPGSLKASTAELTPTTGWNTATVTSQVQLPVGTYWLAYLPSDNNLAFEKGQDATSSGVLYNYTYAALPATFSTSPSTTTSHWSFYATLNSGSSGSVAGDINGDSHVNSGDLTLLLANYGTGYPAADFNNNGTVDAGDFSVVLSNFGK